MVKNRTLFVAAVILTGALAGAFVWAFFFLMDIGLGLFWDTLPRKLDFAFFPLAACLIGGLVIGLYEKRFGPYPESLDTVLAKVKETKRYEYNNILTYSFAALLPLVFGGSVGPEAGLTGSIAGLCTWVGDRMKRFGSDFKNLTEVGISAALSAMFTAPLFGVAAPIYGKTEDDGQDGEETLRLPKPWKIIVYLCAVAGALGIFVILGSLFGEGGGLPHFSAITIGTKELIWLVPLIAAGSLGGFLYHVFDRLSIGISNRMGNRPVIKAVIGGLVLGGCGMLLPLTMFAGESETTVLFQTWTDMSVAVLFSTGLIKLFLTPFCIHSGWRGGHFFPTIFCGVSIGLGFAALSGADPVFCMCACAAAIVGGITKKPLMTVLLLFLCFPLKGVIIMLIAAAVAAAIPLPKTLKGQLD